MPQFRADTGFAVRKILKILRKKAWTFCITLKGLWVCDTLPGREEVDTNFVSHLICLRQTMQHFFRYLSLLVVGMWLWLFVVPSTWPLSYS